MTSKQKISILAIFTIFRFGQERAQIIRISEPIKSTWAQEKGLNLTELLSDGPYKEKYRKEMIIWSDEMRAKDYGVFCKAAASTINRHVVIVSDIRRKTDIKWFRDNFADRIKLIRIRCDDKIRSDRGWMFEVGVDDIQSECDLDDWEEWDLVVENDGLEDAEDVLNKIVELI